MLINMINMNPWLTAEEARNLLGVRAQTLYAYVSRGQIDVSSDPADPRRSLYRADDVATLVKRRERGRKHVAVAESTMSGGEPIIATSISTIARGRLYYRGRDAVALARTATLEESAGLLWQSEVPLGFSSRRSDLPPGPAGRLRAFTALAAAAATGDPTFGRTPKILRGEAAVLVGRLAAAFGAADHRDMPLHQRLAVAWRKDDAVADLIRRALVLLADQELTSSAFAARVTASTGASLEACVLTGMATLSGPLHGDASVRARSLIEEVARTSAEQTVDRHRASGLAIPGFDHPLYPDGDPRAAALLDAFEVPKSIAQMIERVGSVTGLQPNIDVALATLVAHCHLPDDAAFAIFAIGRSVGWLAHVLEQLPVGSVLRPRARYVGPTLETSW